MTPGAVRPRSPGKRGGSPGRPGAAVRARPAEAARADLDAALTLNAAGRPGAAAARFRRALRRLDRTDPADVAGPGDEGAYLRSRALLGLAISEFELSADLDAALDTLRAAERAAETARAPAVAVAVLGQRGLLRLRAGEPAAALAELDRAVSRLPDAEPVDACCLLLNRGSLHLDRGHLDAARADLVSCAARAESLGDALLLFKARHNLGYLEYLEGDLPRALATMADAANLDHGGSPAVALLDQAHVLLEAGLVTDAEAALARAAELFSTQRLPLDLAETQLALARCALLTDRPAEALARARAARTGFARRRNAPGTRRADVMVLRARLARLLSAADRDAQALVGLARRAEDLADADLAARDPGPDRDLARSALATAGEALVAAGRPEVAKDVLRSAGRPNGREQLGLAVHLRLVRAQTAYAEGDRRAGRRQVRAGQALLADHRRQLGSMEALTSAAVHGERLAEVDVGAALATGSPGAVLDAVERARATSAGPARVRPPQDPELAHLLARLRRCLEQERLLSAEGGAEDATRRTDLRREEARLRALVRERSWRQAGAAGAPAPGRARDLLADLRARPAAASPTVADLLTHRGTLYAVAARPTGLVLHALARVDHVTALLRRVRADLQVLSGALLPAPLRAVVNTSLDRGLAELDEAVLSPLGVDGDLHLIAPGALAGVPWGQLPSRLGRATSVGSRLSADPGGGGPSAGAMVALAGPHLSHAEAEVRAAARAWSDGTALVGSQATRAAAQRALSAAAVVHLAAHGRHEVDNPLFAWVGLADGPLFAHELDGVRLPGSLVVLSACELGSATPLAGGEALGLAAALVRLGAHAVVAAVAPLRDDVAAAVMPALHAALAAGVPAPRALAEACARTDELVPLVCLAAGLPRVGRAPA